jgi:hypothetical protein
MPTQSILLRQVEAGNHAVAGALFNTAYQVGASLILAGANALMDRSRETVQGARQVTIDGYLNAFWLIAGVLGAAALTVLVCYWPRKDDLVERQPRQWRLLHWTKWKRLEAFQTCLLLDRCRLRPKRLKTRGSHLENTASPFSHSKRISYHCSTQPQQNYGTFWPYTMQ